MLYYRPSLSPQDVDLTRLAGRVGTSDKRRDSWISNRRDSLEQDHRAPNTLRQEGKEYECIRCFCCDDENVENVKKKKGLCARESYRRREMTHERVRNSVWSQEERATRAARKGWNVA